VGSRPLLVCCWLAALASALGGCADRRDGTPTGAGPAADGRLAAAASAREAAKLVSRSVWGVVPDPPRRKRDLRPGLVGGSAVAVSADTLLVACRAVGGRGRVGLVRHDKYRLARAAPRPGQPEVCELRAPPGTPLVPVRGVRGLGGLGPGEPVYALVSRDGARFALAAGRLTGGPAGPGGSRLATSLELPAAPPGPAAGPLGAVLFDSRGNLVGLAVTGALREVGLGLGASRAGG